MSRRHKKKSDGDEVDSNAWMVTFSDLLTLLMTFFVLLISMSSMDVKSLKTMFSFFVGSANVLEFASQGSIMTEDLIGLQDYSISQLYKKLDAVMEKYNENLLDYELKPQISLISSRKSIFMTFPGNILFDKKDVTIKKKSLTTLKEVAKLLKKTDYKIRIEGHTDDQFVGNKTYPSSWALSARRADSVFQYFLAEGLPAERITAVGYGEYRPLFSNTTDENRNKNRRVEIILEKTSEKKQQF